MGNAVYLQESELSDLLCFACLICSVVYLAHSQLSRSSDFLFTHTLTRFFRLPLILARWSEMDVCSDEIKAEHLYIK